MKNMKKMLVLVLALIIAASSFSAYADVSAQNYAYMDIDSASEALKGKILEAREAIIYSQAWTVDGQCDDSTTVETLPKRVDAVNFLSNAELTVLNAGIIQAVRMGIDAVVFGNQWVLDDVTQEKRRLTKDEYDAAMAGKIAINWREVYWDDPDSPEEIRVFRPRAVEEAKSLE